MKLRIRFNIKINAYECKLGTNWYVKLDIINFIYSKIINLTEFKMDNYPRSTFYMNSNGEYILEQNNRNDVLWCRYRDFWEVLELKYQLKYSDIQILIQYMVEKALKMRVSTSFILKPWENHRVEKAYRMKVSTPWKAYN